MTIDELNALTTLTAADEVPVWDAEASGEPTKKITAQNFASSVKTLGSLLGTSDVVNNLTSTAPTKVLGAPQGKVLNDKITDKVLLYQYTKQTRASGATLTFETSDNRYTALVLIVDNDSFNKSGVYAVIYKKNTANIVTKLAGNGNQVSCDINTGTMSCIVGTWSEVYVITSVVMT